MKTCTFKKALSLLLAVMMIATCFTVLSVSSAAAVTWDGFKTDYTALYNQFVNQTEWIPVGQTSGNGKYTGTRPDDGSAFIYAFAQDSTKIYAFIEIANPDVDKKVTVRLDSNRDTLTARSHELVFENKGNGVWEQTNEEMGVDVDYPNGVTSGKFTDGSKADFAGTAFMKGYSYEYGVINVEKNYNGATEAKRTAQVLVLQLRKDRLQGNSGNGDYSYVGKLGFDIELDSGDYGKVNTSKSKDPANDATDFNVFDIADGKVIRFELDGKITGNEFWKDNEWQLVTGLNGQMIGYMDQTDIAYDFQVTGDNKNVYIGVKLYGQSYKDGDKASSFKVYMNVDENAAKTKGNEPTEVLEFVFNGTDYEFVGASANRFAHLEVASYTHSETYTEIEIKIPYRDIELVSYDLKYGSPYNYLGFNFEYTAPAYYSNEQYMISLVARSYGDHEDHPANNCYRENYFTYNSNYPQYYLTNYYVDKYNAKDYGNNLAFEAGEISNQSSVDALVNELTDNFASNQQVIFNRVSATMQTGAWTNGKPGQDDNHPAIYADTYFDYLMFSDGETVYVGVKSYTPNKGIANGQALSQTHGSFFRLWLANAEDNTAWDELVDFGFNYDAAGKPTEIVLQCRAGAIPALASPEKEVVKIGEEGKNIKYVLDDDHYTLAFTMKYSDLEAANSKKDDVALASDNGFKYAFTHTFNTKFNDNGTAVNGSYVQLSSGFYLGKVESYTSSSKAYRVMSKNPDLKLVRTSYTADEALKKNVLADAFYYTHDWAGDPKFDAGLSNTTYTDNRIDPEHPELLGKVKRGNLNDGVFDATFAWRNGPSTLVTSHEKANVYSADYGQEITFQLLREYNIAGFKAAFLHMANNNGGIGTPDYVDVYVTNANGNTQRVGRYYSHLSLTDADGLSYYDITLNKAVVGNKVTFKFTTGGGSYTFANEFQAYTYDENIVTTNGCNYNSGGFDPVMLYAQNSNGATRFAWWTTATPVFKYDTKLGAYYMVSNVDSTDGTAANIPLNYKTGDFAITSHGNATSAQATAAQKANYAKLASIVVGERVNLYNTAHKDANYDLMMQPSSNNFFISIGNDAMSGRTGYTAYDPTVGYVYNFTDLAQIGNGKETMILIDSQTKPDKTVFDSVALPVDSFTVGSLADPSISLWNYSVATVAYDTVNKVYYIDQYMAPITRNNGESDTAWNTRAAANNAAKRALSFSTQGFAIVALNANGELTARLSRMWANDYTIDAVDKANSKAPDAVYLYDIDIDALRLSYGNAGALNAKVTFNNKNGKDNVTTTESWVDLAESSLGSLTDRWMGDLEAIRSQISTETYNNLKTQISNNIKYARAFAVFANKFNQHEFTAGLRANPWVMYDGKTEATNLSFDENIFALWNRNSQWAIGATQTAGIMLMNTDKNYEVKTEVTGFNKNFAALHDNDYAALNYINKITYTFYYDFANGYNVPETLRVYTSRNYSFMNHTKPYEITLTDKTSDDGQAYPSSGNGTWTVTLDLPLTAATAVYTEFDFTSKQLGVVEINEKCVITDLMSSQIDAIYTDSTGCVATNIPNSVTVSKANGEVTIKHDHSAHNVANHTCNTECTATVENEFYGNTFVDLSKTPYLHVVMDVPANLSATEFAIYVYYNGVERLIALENIVAREVNDGHIDYCFDFADFCKNTYGMTLKDGELLQLSHWYFRTKFADKETGTIVIKDIEFIAGDEVVSDLVAGSEIKLDSEKGVIILDKQYKTDALKQQFTGSIGIEGVGSNDYVGTGDKVTVNGTEYSVVLYGDLNGDGVVNPADYIMIRRSILKSVELDEVQTLAAIGPKAEKITPTTYIQIRQHVLGTYNFFKGEKIAQ